MTLTNGLGGFTDDGRDLRDRPRRRRGNADAVGRTSSPTRSSARSSPRPGSAHTWSGNSRENRLTPFANDPISDPTGEALFIRDDETGESWSPTPGPAAATPASGRCVVRHTAGLTHFSRVDARHRPRAGRLRRRRRSGEVLAAHADQRRRRGADAERLRLQRVGARTAARRRAPARRHRARRSRPARSSRSNAYNQEFAGHVAFAYASETPALVHRRSPIVHRPQRRPVAAGRAAARRRSSGRRRRGARSVRGASRFDCVLQPGERRQLLFLLGEGTDRDRRRAADRPSRTASTPPSRRARACSASWDDTLDADPGAHAGRFVRRADEPLAALSGR